VDLVGRVLRTVSKAQSAAFQLLCTRTGIRMPGGGCKLAARCGIYPADCSPDAFLKWQNTAVCILPWAIGNGQGALKGEMKMAQAGVDWAAVHHLAT